jgi:hypothetical protein
VKPTNYIVLNTEGGSASNTSSIYKGERRESGITAKDGLSSKAADISNGD